QRLNQIGLQRLGQTLDRSGTSRLLGQKAVVDELKLTDDQKKQLADNARLTAVLTEAQQAKWKEMLGDPFTGLLQPSFGGGTPVGGGFPGRTLPEIVYLRQVSVQQELKLTDTQKEKITSLAQKRLTPTEKELAEVLEPEQLKRLKQIMLQEQQRT